MIELHKLCKMQVRQQVRHQYALTYTLGGKDKKKWEDMSSEYIQ